MSIYKGSQLVAGSSTNTVSDIIKLFKHDWYDYSFSDLSWVRADDFEWIYADRYPIAYEHLYADFISTSTWQSETIGSYTIQFKIAPDGHRITDHANEGIVQNIYGESGVAWYYIIDTVNERFKLPRTKHGITGLRDEVGKYIPESLPNIKGEWYPYSSMGGSGSGAFYGSAGNNTATRGSGGGSNVLFNASYSSSTYQDNAPVQERATQQYLYFYLGQFPVSALVNPDIAATKVNTNGDNFNSVGRNIANWSSNVTNCITEIPQDIKLELNDGTLTLKAGSKLYIPNGFESDGTTPKFNIRVLTEDIVRTKAESLYAVSNAMLIIRGTIDFIDFWPATEYYSGPTAPSTGNIWYDTTTNLIKRNISGTWTSEQQNLPIGLANVSDTDGFISINQVFNGFSYIGSTIFALPGVKGLSPDGRNEDGTLKNKEIAVSEVRIFTFTGDITTGVNLFLTPNGLATWFELDCYTTDILPQDEYSHVYMPSKNEYWYKQTSAYSKCNDCWYGVCGVINTKITSFTPKAVQRIADYSNCVKYCSFNTNTRIQITDTDQIAPKNGWLIGFISHSGNNKHCQIIVNNIQISRYGWTESNGSWRTGGVQIPLKAGQTFRYWCDGTVQEVSMYFYPDD